jgi:hypothetical protein
MSNDLEAATDRVFAAMDDYRTGEAVHATRQVAQALARAALEGVREENEHRNAAFNRLRQENERLRWTRCAMPAWNDLPTHARVELSRPTPNDPDGLFYDYLHIRDVVMGAFPHAALDRAAD